jgi:DNA-binding protein Fis
MDLSIFPQLTLGRRVQTGSLVAVAPELWSGEALDERADLYALACLFLSQRGRGLFQRFDTPQKLLELHRGGRLADFVPKTPSRLNDLLRKMLQFRPDDRPASAAACLREIRGEDNVAAGGKRPLLAVRAARRQETMIFTTLYSLLQEKEWSAAQAWLEEIRPRYAKTHEAYFDYFEAYLQRHLDPQNESNPGRRSVAVSDPKLKILWAVEKAAWERRSGRLSEAVETLNHAWKDAKNDPDPELQARILLNRSRFLRAEKKQVAAMEDLEEAYERIQGIPGGRLRQAITGDLADLFLQHGLNETGALLAKEALELTGSHSPMAKARLQILLGSALLKMERWEDAHNVFSEAKSVFGAHKRLDALIWACAHEMRLFLAQGDYPKARREWRMLQARAKSFPLHRKWLALIHALVWMESGELPSPNTEREVSPLIKSSGLTDFVELGWGREDTCRLLAHLARRLGREDLFQSYSEKAERLREEAAACVKKFGKRFGETAPAKVEKIPAAKKLATREPPKPSPEREEKSRIEDLLQRHKGNREKTAKELGINRRTLFAKLEKYGLKDLSFLPTREEILEILETCKGKKNEAAKKLGMSRATFYRHLKDLGLLS